MTLTQIYIALAALVLFAIFCGWRGARRPDPRKGPRLIPWRALMAASAAGVMMMLYMLARALGVTN